MKKMNKYMSVLMFGLFLFVLQYLYFEYRFQRFTDEFYDTQYELGEQQESIEETVSEINQMMYTAQERSFVNTHRTPLPVVFCGDTLDNSDPLMRERIEREFFSMLNKQGQIQLYLKRSAKYFPMIEAYLRAAGLPDDLKYLAVHESALLPRIRSRSNAVGMWQFMRSTGRLYKLRINRYVDERRDPPQATAAAMRMLKDLYRQFKTWPLVLAAYNGGNNRVKRSLSEQNAETFFDLSLPEETERYYFKIVVTKIIVSQPQRFGFHLEENDLFQPVDITRLKLNVSDRSMPLDQVAEMCNLSLARFKDLNPQFIKSTLPPGSYSINIPSAEYAYFREKSKKSSSIESSIREEGLINPAQ
jgi:hypothetical protein